MFSFIKDVIKIYFFKEESNRLHREKQIAIAESLRWKDKYEKICVLLEQNKELIIYPAKTHKGLDVFMGHETYKNMRDGRNFEIFIWVDNGRDKKGQLPILYSGFQRNNKLIKIFNIQSFYENNGIAQLALNKLFEIGRELGYTRVIGNLSEVDLCKRRDLLIYFYQKLGFEITWNETSSLYIKATIEKYL